MGGACWLERGRRMTTDKSEETRTAEVVAAGTAQEAAEAAVAPKPAATPVQAPAATPASVKAAAPRPTVQGAPKAKKGRAAKKKAKGSSGAASAKQAPKAGSPDDDNSENKASARKGALFLGGVVIVYVIYLILSGQMGSFVTALATVDKGWIARACFCFVLYYVFGVMAYAIDVYLDHDSPVGMSVEASGLFFGNLTPMMAGSIPSQIWRLTRTGLDVGRASATQFTRFIMFQLGVVLFAAIMLAAKAEYFFETFGDLFLFNILIFAVHLLELAGLFVVCLCPNFVKRVGNWAINFVDRHGWMKDRAHWDEMVNVQVDEFSSAFRHAMTDLPSMGLTLLVTMAQLACLYMIPWFVLGAFGIEADFLECLAGGAMVEMVTSAVPLPGGTGGAEGGFIMFFGHMFGSQTASGFLVWRIIEFFAPTLLAAPLLSLKSDGGESIYHRVQRIKNGTPREGGKGGRRKGGRGGKGGITVRVRK